MKNASQRPFNYVNCWSTSRLSVKPFPLLNKIIVTVMKKTANMVGVSHLEVPVNSNHSHERNAGRAVGEHQEEVDPAYSIPKNPVPPEQGIDPQRQADEHQEVRDDQVEEEQVVGVPGLHLKAEYPQGDNIPQYSQYDIYCEHRGKNQTL